MSAVIAALSIQGLRAGYGSADDIVRGIDLDVGPETIVAIIGPNGSGKSTFVRAVSGVIMQRAGSISLTGTDVSLLSAPKRVAAGLAYVPQTANVFAGLTVRENRQIATEFLRSRPGVGQAHEATVMALFPELWRRERGLAGDLSGGQRQMLALSCALFANPEVLLLDEPSAGLSPRFVGETMEAIKRVRASGVTVVLVEQNVRAALDIADDVLVLVAGRARLRAPASDIEVDRLADLFFEAVISA